MRFFKKNLPLLFQEMPMTASELVEISTYGLTHIGKVREDNQDAVRICDLDDDESISAVDIYLA